MRLLAGLVLRLIGALKQSRHICLAGRMEAIRRISTGMAASKTIFGVPITTLSSAIAGMACAGLTLMSRKNS